MTLEQIIKEIGLTKEQLETIVDTYNHKNLRDILNEQVKYTQYIKELKDFLTKAITVDYQKLSVPENEDMYKGAAIAYQDIYNHLSEIMNDELREDSIN